MKFIYHQSSSLLARRANGELREQQAPYKNNNEQKREHLQGLTHQHQRINASMMKIES